jgi:hypothetical protein
MESPAKLAAKDHPVDSLAPIWVLQRGCYGIADRPNSNKLLWTEWSPPTTFTMRRRLAGAWPNSESSAGQQPI